MAQEKSRYSDAELEEFKALINKKCKKRLSLKFLDFFSFFIQNKEEI
jgi:hypothetical protein